MLLAPSHAFILGSVAVAVAAGGWLYADHLGGRVDELTIERDAAIADRQAAERAMVVLADEAQAAAGRALIRSSGRESILAMPVTEDGPISGVLRHGLDIADEIGGLK